MSYQDLEKLIYSLSSSEKKQFQLYANQFKTETYYAQLFYLIDDKKNKPGENWKVAFKELCPKVSLESTATYLFKILIDVLLQIRVTHDSWYQQHYGLMKAQLCFERSIPEQGLKEINVVYKKAEISENLINKYSALRMELDAMHQANFLALNEQEVIDRQMDAKMTIQVILEVQEHHSLYELLNIRLAKKPNIDQYMDDLILGELNLSFRRKGNRFETQKLHLLFQAYYFIHKVDYQSALHIFTELSNLFEKNIELWNSPPYDYLSVLNGILDSLFNMEKYSEMENYLQKIAKLQDQNYSEHFQKLIKLTIYRHQLRLLLGDKKLNEILELIETVQEKHINLHIAGQDIAMECYYLQALTYFYLGNYALAKKMLNELFSTFTQVIKNTIYRSAKLLYLMTIYELDDWDYIESAIRSHKRLLRKIGKRYMTENLVFRFIGMDPKRRGNAWKRKNLIFYSTLIVEINSNRINEPLLKYFDYQFWINNMLKSSHAGNKRG